MRLSQSEQLRGLHAELLKTTKALPKPPKLDEDRCLARVLKFCIYLSTNKSVHPSSLERAFAEFKEEFPVLMRKDEKRDDLILLCRNIHAKKDDIMSIGIQKDYLEMQGFTYNEKTFDDIFINKWRGFTGPNLLESSSDSNEEEKKQESKDGGWGDELDDVMKESFNPTEEVKQEEPVEEQVYE